MAASGRFCEKVDLLTGLRQNQVIGQREDSQHDGTIVERTRETVLLVQFGQWVNLCFQSSTHCPAFSRIQLARESSVGRNDLPSSVIWYSTRGGTSAYTVR